MQDTTTSRKPNRLLTSVFLPIVAVLLIGSAAGMYLWLHSRATVLRKQAAALQTQLTALQQQTAQLQEARNISTSNWKAYCDPHANFCFKYPDSWSLTSNYESEVGIGSATLKNPTSTLTVSYLDAYLKDGTSASFVVHSVSPLGGAGKNLLALGGYYVSSGSRTPMYIVVSAGTNTTSPALSNKPGQTILAPLGPVFQYTYGSGGTALGQFVVQGKSYPTTQQADAWFDSIDGQTAFKLIGSFTSGSGVPS